MVVGKSISPHTAAPFGIGKMIFLTTNATIVKGKTNFPTTIAPAVIPFAPSGMMIGAMEMPIEAI